jgi:hypothetical protein
MDACIVDGCDRRAERGRKYCRGHRERATEGRYVYEPLRRWGRTPEEALLDAAHRASEASTEAVSDESFRLAVKLLRRAAARYALALGERRRTKVATTKQTGSIGPGGSPRGR